MFLPAGSRAGYAGSRFLTKIDAWAPSQGSPELRFGQKQDPAAAFFEEAIRRDAVPKQVTKELKLAD
jgi:hypothetical protein